LSPLPLPSLAPPFDQHLTLLFSSSAPLGHVDPRRERHARGGARPPRRTQGLKARSNRQWSKRSRPTGYLWRANVRVSSTPVGFSQAGADAVVFHRRDAVYLAQKSSKPLSWEMWVSVRELVDYACSRTSLFPLYRPPRTQILIHRCLPQSGKRPISRSGRSEESRRFVASSSSPHFTPPSALNAAANLSPSYRTSSTPRSCSGSLSTEDCVWPTSDRFLSLSERSGSRCETTCTRKS
jgi:hypothetical protein